MISAGQVTGKWKNSKESTSGISEFSLERINNRLELNIKGANGGFLPEQLGPIDVSVHSANLNSKDCIAFHGSANTDDQDYSFAGNVNKGLIIIATYVKIKSDESSNFFVREFFYKLK